MSPISLGISVGPYRRSDSSSRLVEMSIRKSEVIGEFSRCRSLTVLFTFFISQVVSTVQSFRQALIERPTAWNDEVTMNLLGFNFPRARQMFLNFAEAKDLRNFATAERRIFVVLSRYSEACWINSAIPDFVSALCFRQISALFIDAWTSEQDFMVTETASSVCHGVH